MKKKIIKIISFILTLIILTSISYGKTEYENIKAKVILTNEIKEVEEDNTNKKIQIVTIRILEGEFKNEEYKMEYVLTENTEDVTEKAQLLNKVNILVNLEEENGEIVGVTYKEMLQENIILYIILVLSLIAVIIVERKRVIKPIIEGIIVIAICIMLTIITLFHGWNMIIAGIIFSTIITICINCLVKGINVNKYRNIYCITLGTIIISILIYIFLDKIETTNTVLLIKNSKLQINVKELIETMWIIISNLICNIISILANFKNRTNKVEYKVKSDNIIDGKRSLKV